MIDDVTGLFLDLSEYGYGLLLEPFVENSFMTRALIVSVLVGVMCPVIGAYVVARGRAFMGDALAHSVLPGMGVGLLATGSALIAAVPTGVAIALLMGFISRRTGSSEDTSIGIVFAGMFALGLVMLSSPLYISSFRQLRDTQAPNIEDLLIGEILGVSTGEVYLSLGLALLVIAGLYVFHRHLIYTTFDPVGAEVVGIKTRFVEYVLLALLALVIVTGIQAAGIVLVMAMLITPAATGFLLARRFVGVMVVGALIGILSVVVGMYLSFHANMPTGPVMALVATAVFGLAAAKGEWTKRSST